MTTKTPLAKEKKNQTHEIVLAMIKKQKPQTVRELIKLIQEKDNLTEREKTNLILKLRKEHKHCFTKRQTLIPSTLSEFMFSKRASWGWAGIATAIAATISIFIIPENAYPAVYLRFSLGLLLVLFLPGYAFVRMLFPQKLFPPTGSNNMDNAKSITLGIGVSLTLISMIGLILNSTPWGINLAPITLSLLALTIVFTVGAIFREYQTNVQKIQPVSNINQ